MIFSLKLLVYEEYKTFNYDATKLHHIFGVELNFIQDDFDMRVGIFPS